MFLEGCLDQLYDHMVSSKLLKSNSPTGRTKPSYRAKKPGFFPCINTPNNTRAFQKVYKGACFGIKMMTIVICTNDQCKVPPIVLC